MLSLTPGGKLRRLTVLCIGAHSDDIEIGCAGTLLRWLHEHEQLHVTWVVCSAPGLRAQEARQSAQRLLQGAAGLDIVLGNLADARMTADLGAAKDFIGGLRERVAPDVVLTHRLEDRHQDHRLVAELTWQTWRHHTILEYEIPKYEGDLGQPNVYLPLPEALAECKVAHLLEHFGSQRAKDWFDADTFRALMRLRGVECRAPAGFAEAFHGRKLTL